MFESITCLRVDFTPRGVVTVFTYQPDDVPSFFTSWGKFETKFGDCGYLVEICTPDEHVTLSRRVTWSSTDARAKHRVPRCTDRIL